MLAVELILPTIDSGKFGGLRSIVDDLHAAQQQKGKVSDRTRGAYIVGLEVFSLQRFFFVSSPR